jgi:hypothetical protein
MSAVPARARLTTGRVALQSAYNLPPVESSTVEGTLEKAEGLSLLMFFVFLAEQTPGRFETLVRRSLDTLPSKE